MLADTSHLNRTLGSNFKWVTVVLLTLTLQLLLFSSESRTFADAPIPGGIALPEKTVPAESEKKAASLEKAPESSAEKNSEKPPEKLSDPKVISENPSAANYIAVGTAKTKKAVVAFPEIRQQNGVTKAWAKILTETVVSDLEFMNQYQFLPTSSFVEKSNQTGINPGTFKYEDWTGIGAEFLIKSELRLESKTQILTWNVHLYDTYATKELLGRSYSAPTRDAKTMAHTFANELVSTLTSLPGIFLTKIAMSCDGTGKTEIYLMNFDGSGEKQLTRHHSISFSPAWNPDGSRLAYSVYTKNKQNIKNIDLYEYNFANSTIRPISTRKGINSGAAYSPDGKKIAATLSYRGNPDLFLLDPGNLKAIPNRITHSFGFDVDPNWSPDGKEIAFVSSRAGIPMIYKVNRDGTNTQRLTYAGKYNATPSWSPVKGPGQNTKIAFAGWLDKGFDIFTMNSDGTNIERLTKDQGSNEDPYYSPDGNFIVFSSNRTGQKNIYVMNQDGTYTKRLTYGLGNCVSPKWSGLKNEAPGPAIPGLRANRG